jgi:hypothetical protein
MLSTLRRPLMPGLTRSRDERVFEPNPQLRRF